LAAEDKAAADVVEMNIDPATIKHPVIRDTWIQTSTEDEDRRTGVRSTVVIGELDGAADEDNDSASIQNQAISTGMVIDNEPLLTNQPSQHCLFTIATPELGSVKLLLSNRRLEFLLCYIDCTRMYFRVILPSCIDHHSRS